MIDGREWVMEWRQPSYLYSHEASPKIFCRHFQLSDDVGYRFSNKSWPGWPLTADAYASWIGEATGDMVFIGWDYETFGEHHDLNTGIFDFMRHLPAEVFDASPDNDFLTPSQVADRYEPVGELDVPHLISWADTERDLSAWLGNAMQSNALHELYKLEGAMKEKNDPDLLTDWRRGLVNGQKKGVIKDG